MINSVVFFDGDSLNPSRFNVNSGSADVRHTSVFFSRLSLSVYTCLYLLCLHDNQGGGLFDFWNGGADMLTWGGRNYLGSYPSGTSRYQKC